MSLSGRKFAILLTILAAFVLASGPVTAGLAIVTKDGQQVYPPPADTTTSPAEPEIEYRKYALVIGVSNYRNVTRIKNAANDAALITKTLGELEFDVVTVLNPGKRSLESSIADYAETIGSGNSISVVYYAGHGVQMGGVDYLIPADLDPKTEEDVKNGSVVVRDMIDEIDRHITSGASLLFIDASRTNPFGGNTTRGSAPVIKSGLARVSAIGTAVMYSASDGAEALDGDGDNGPFALALAAQLQEPGLDILELFRRVRNEVIKTTAGRQVPVSYDTLTAKLILNRDETAPLLPEEPPETRAAKVLYRKADGELEPTYADGSYALLIGVGDYASGDSGQQAWADLPNVKDELTRLGGVLEQVHGFEVETVFDPTGDELETALEQFVNVHGPQPNARLVIMMSGHGATTERYGRKTAWFVPSDAPALEPPGPFFNTSLNLRRVEEWSEIMAAKHVMWIFDSCFSGAAIRMIERKGNDKQDGWTEYLHQNPVRRVLTAGSENEEVPAKSRFTETLIRVLGGQDKVDGAGDFITGQQLGAYVKRDILRYNYKQGLPKNTPQSDTIVIPGEEGDVVFSVDPGLSAKWTASAQ